MEEEIDLDAKPVEPYIWTFYPPGWKRDAFRLYEENRVSGENSNHLDLIRDEDVARRIKEIIEPCVGFHEIVACQIWDAREVKSHEFGSNTTLFGFDVAYLGGDFYSAIFNGLFVNPSRTLLLRYKSILNEYGLFPKIDPIPEYLREFKQETLSEQSSNFYVWELELVS